MKEPIFKAVISRHEIADGYYKQIAGTAALAVKLELITAIEKYPGMGFRVNLFLGEKDSETERAEDLQNINEHLKNELRAAREECKQLEAKMLKMNEIIIKAAEEFHKKVLKVSLGKFKV